MMIEINLLPEELRPRKRGLVKLDIEMDKIKLVGGIVFVGVLILLIAVPAVGIFIRKSQIQPLMKKEANLIPRRSKIEIMNKELGILKTKVNSLKGITMRRFLWAKKLNELSDLILPHIWFTRVRTDREDKLVIEGSVVSRGEDAMALVGKFIKNIRDDNSFFRDFKDIKLESIQCRSIEKPEIVDFIIVLYFNLL